MNGTLDQTFGTGGWATVDLGGGNEGALSLILESGGKLVTAGYTNADGAFRPAFTRLNVDGTPDTTFGTAGATILDFGADESWALGFASQSDGKLVSVGPVTANAETTVGLARLSADGVPDPTFGTNGLLTLESAGRFEAAQAVAVQTDDSIVIAGFEFVEGTDHINGVLRRRDAEGNADNSFGTGGKAVFDFGSESVFDTVVVLSDGKLAVTGYRLTDEFFRDLIVSRFSSTGQLDQVFGIDGVATADFGDADVVASSEGFDLIQQFDGKVVAAGRNFNTGSFAIARFDDGAASAGRIGFTATFRTAAESEPAVSYTVRRTGGKTGLVSVNYATVAGSAQTDSDFVGTSGTLDWNDGDTSDQSITIDLIDDELAETPEAFSLILSSPTGGARLAASEATAYIQSTDGPGELQFLYQLFDSAVWGTEGDSGLTVPVLRRYGSEGAISVSYTVLSGGTASEGEDFVMSGTLSWADGDTESKSITIDYLEDALVEGTEGFRIALTSPTGGVTLHNSYRFQDCVIRDNNRGFGFSSPSVSVPEQSTSVAVTIVASDPQGAAASVEYSTASGSATAGSDFTSTSGTLSWVTGDPDRKTIEIPISNDAQDEPGETFTVSLANPTEGFSLGTAVITVTIVDNDSAGGSGGGGGGGGGGATGVVELLLALSALFAQRRRRYRGPTWLVEITVTRGKGHDWQSTES